MDLSAVTEIDAADAEKLREAGVPHAEALAIWPDLPPLAERAGIDLARVEAHRDAARASIERALAQAGVQEPQALAAADLDALAEKTGIDAAYLQHYQRKARDALGKVVLVDGAPVARVHLLERTHDAVPLVTAGPADEDDAVLARAEGDAVLLKPQAEVAIAHIGGVTHRALPLYKEKRREGGETEEIRVRVVDIREVEAQPEKKGGLGRLFSRKK